MPYWVEANDVLIRIVLEDGTGKVFTNVLPLGQWLNEDDGGSWGLEQAYHDAGRKFYDDPEMGFSFQVKSIEALMAEEDEDLNASGQEGDQNDQPPAVS